VRQSIVKKNSLSISTKFIITLLTVMGVITAVVTIINAAQIRRQIDAYVLERLQRNAVLTASILETLMVYTMWTMDAISNLPQVQEQLTGGAPEGLQETLAALFNSYNRERDGVHSHGNFLIFDSDMNLVVAANPDGEFIDITFELFSPNITMARGGRPLVSPVFHNPTSGLMQYLFTRPVIVQGQFVGMVAHIGNAKGLSMFIYDYADLENSLVNIAGGTQVIFHSDTEMYVGRHLDDLVHGRRFVHLPRNTMFTHASAISGMSKITYIMIDDRTGWIITSSYETDALPSILPIVAWSLVPMLIGMVLATVLLTVFIRWAFKPLATLTAAAKEVAKGNLDNRFNVDSDDEISMVAESFLMVTDALRVLQDNFKQAEAAMARGDLLYRLKDASLGGAYSEILGNTNSILNAFQTFFELLSEPIIIIDGGLRVRYANSIMRTYTETGDKKYAGTFINDYVKGDLSQHFAKQFKKGSSVLATEVQLQLNSSQLFDIELSCIPFEVDGKIEGAVLILADVTKVKQMQRAQIEAESASRAKSDFLSKMSHEIRTPMNFVVGLTDMQLLKGGLNPDTEEAFFNIKMASGTLLSIINDILDLSKVEAGKLEIRQLPYELNSLIFDALQINLVYMSNENIQFTLDITENVPTSFIGDELRIKQILNNLMSNAFKYTKAGSIRLLFDAEKDNGQAYLIMEVSDTGSGMTKEQLDSLFGEYVRFDESNNRLIEGTGLGLNITNRLIQMMNGTITPTSEPGVGSTFRVRLPQESAGGETLDRNTIENLQNFRITAKDMKRQYDFKYEPMTYGSVLIVDDVESNLMVAKGLIAPYGIKTETASNGYEAIDMVSEGKVYDIIFMDHMMPGLDGVETGQRIMEMGYKKPIVALTANTIIGQAEMFMANGFSGFLAKPIDVSAMNGYLVRFIRDVYPQEVVEAAKAAASQNPTATPDPESQGPSAALVAAFLRDAVRAIDILDALEQKSDWTEKDYKLYTINTHGIKSALANINQPELSKAALKLEQAGRAQNIEVVRADTPAFLEKLRNVVAGLSPEEPAPHAAEENTDLLRDKLKSIRDSCELYNKKDTRQALEELSQHNWSKATKDLLDSINAKLLHSAFEEIAELIDKFFKVED